MMTTEQSSLLSRAATVLDPVALTKYGIIRNLYPILSSGEGSAGHRAQFEKTFSDFYKMNRFPTLGWKRRYFELLFDSQLPEGGEGYRFALKALLPLSRPGKKPSLHCSFVSKLVATREELRPLYDTHVSNFFGIFVPRVGSVDFRINQWLENLESLRHRYGAWVQNPDFQKTIRGLKTRYGALKDVPDVRICDLLVWTVGRAKLWPPTEIEAD